MKMVLVTVMLALFNSSCAHGSPKPPLETVPYVDLNRYLGTWYEIASFPQSFQKGCVATQAQYSLRDEGKIDVLNSCRNESLDGKLREAHGKAKVVDTNSNSKLKVTFFWPFYGDYWIIGLDQNYQWAIVGAPDRNYLWILSRSRHLDPEILNEILKIPVSKGFDISKLKMTLQP